MGAIKKAGVQFHAKIDTNRDLIGAAAQFTAAVIKDSDGLVDATATVGAFAEIGSTGIYRAPITILNEGDYTIDVTWTDGVTTEHIPFPVEIKGADMTDLNTLLTALQTDMTSVKTQVDTLDEAGVNSLVATTSQVQTTVDSIKKLVVDNVASVVLAGDQSAAIVAGDILTGVTSAAYGTVTSSTFDAVSGNTTVAMNTVVGTFANGEDVNVNGGTALGLAVLSTTVSAVNSVMEFVDAINTALSSGGTSLSALSGYTDNLELMLEGKAYTDTTGVAVAAIDSKGLAEIFAEIVANGTSITAANTAIANLNTAMSVFRTSVEGKVDQVQLDLTAGVTNIRADIAAVKTVADANALVLGDAVYGNAALKNLLTGLDTTLTADMVALNSRFDTVDTNAAANIATVTTAIANLDGHLTTVENAITAQTATMTGRFDTLDTAIASISGTQNYKGFV